MYMDLQQGIEMQSDSNWEKQLLKGLLELVVLLCLHSGRNHGYGLVTKIKGQLGVKIAEGTIYPLLKKLEAQSLIISDWDHEGRAAPRKTYMLTSLGRKMLNSRKKRWLEFTTGVEELVNDGD